MLSDDAPQLDPNAFERLWVDDATLEHVVAAAPPPPPGCPHRPWAAPPAAAVLVVAGVHSAAASHPGADTVAAMFAGGAAGLALVPYDPARGSRDPEAWLWGATTFDGVTRADRRPPLAAKCTYAALLAALLRVLARTNLAAVVAIDRAAADIAALALYATRSLAAARALAAVARAPEGARQRPRGSGKPLGEPRLVLVEGRVVVAALVPSPYAAEAAAQLAARVDEVRAMVARAAAAPRAPGFAQLVVPPPPAAGALLDGRVRFAPLDALPAGWPRWSCVGGYTCGALTSMAPTAHRGLLVLGAGWGAYNPARWDPARVAAVFERVVRAVEEGGRAVVFWATEDERSYAHAMLRAYIHPDAAVDTRAPDAFGRVLGDAPGFVRWRTHHILPAALPAAHGHTGAAAWPYAVVRSRGPDSRVAAAADELETYGLARARCCADVVAADVGGVVVGIDGDVTGEPGLAGVRLHSVSAGPPGKRVVLARVRDVPFRPGIGSILEDEAALEELEDEVEVDPEGFLD